MSVVGTIVANIVANTAQFEAGMKKAASIHQSTIKQIQQHQEPLHRQFFGKSDFIKNISKAERISASDWSKELITAGEKTQKEIAARASKNPVKLKVDAGPSFVDAAKDVALLAGGFTAAAGTALSLASAYDELQKSNWIAKNAEQLAEYNKRLDEAVELIGRLSSNTKLADSIRGAIAFGGPLSGISGRLAQDLSSGKQSRFASGLFEFDNNAQRLIQSQEATLTPGQFLQNADGKRAQLQAQVNFALQKLGSLSDFTFARTGFADKYNAYATGDMASIRAYEAAVKEHEQLMKEAQKPLVEFNKAIAEFQVNAVDAAQSLATELPALKNRVMGGKSVFEMANDLTASGGRSIFGAGLGGLKDLAKTLTDPTARRNLLGDSLPAGEALKAELTRIGELERRGQLLGDDANLMRGNARNRFASQLGSGFNQTRLFAAMTQGSSAAISAINEAQNRIKTPEQMSLEEMRKLEEEQLRELRKIGERTAIELKAANWTK